MKMFFGLIVCLALVMTCDESFAGKRYRSSSRHFTQSANTCANGRCANVVRQGSTVRTTREGVSVKPVISGKQ